MWGQTSDRNFVKLVSQIEVDKVTRRALLRATDASVSVVVEHYSREVFAEQLSNVLREAGAKAAGAIMTSVVAGLIEAIWKQNDLLKSQVNRLISQPLISGSQMAYEAVNLPDKTATEKKFKEHRLNAAVDELFRAWGLLKNRQADTFDRYVIAKLQGLCFYQLDGGKESAFNRFDEAIGILNQRKGKIRASYLINLSRMGWTESPEKKQFYGKHYEQTIACTSDTDFDHIIHEHVADLKTIVADEYHRLFLMEKIFYSANPDWVTELTAKWALDYLNGYLELSRMAQVLTEIRRN